MSHEFLNEHLKRNHHIKGYVFNDIELKQVEEFNYLLRNYATYFVKITKDGISKFVLITNKINDMHAICVILKQSIKSLRTFPIKEYEIEYVDF